MQTGEQAGAGTSWCTRIMLEKGLFAVQTAAGLPLGHLHRELGSAAACRPRAATRTVGLLPPQDASAGACIRALVLRRYRADFDKPLRTIQGFLQKHRVLVIINPAFNIIYYVKIGRPLSINVFFCVVGSLVKVG
jgi:hypothetical protein